MSAAALHEVWNDRLHPIERRFHVHGHHEVELFVGELQHRGVVASPHVVDPYVHRTEGADRLIAKSLDVGAASHVGHDWNRIRGYLITVGVERVRSPRGENQPKAPVAKPPRERGADAATRPCDYCNAIGLHLAP